ncbi:MAG: DNA polymerase III subunit alpha [Chitinophagaceae bacterium]|nr:DNA polymerase III subunit alpha [Chitinophagaceae bacterium]
MYLNCKTNFSFRYGTMSAEELVKAGAEKGAGSIALTNINSTGDIWNFVRSCLNHGIKPITGVEIRNDGKLLYILLAANNDGLAWINRFLSVHLQKQVPFPEQSESQGFFVKAYDGFVIYPVGKKSLKGLLSNEFIGITPWEINKLYGLDLRQYEQKFVVRHPVTFRDNDRNKYNVHKLLRAIDKNILLSKLSPDDLAFTHEYFVHPSEILQAFKQYPFVVANTYQLMDACHISIEWGTNKNKKIFSSSKPDDKELLKKLAYDGWKSRYGNNELAKQRVDKELEIIDQSGFTPYFLITWDIVRYAKYREFYYVGRGSGANSVVSYCLYITDVDPIELDLCFERFLNPQRTSPPDFDIDFSWLDRDEVIDYVFKRYGADHVALLGSYPTFQFNATIRELGKVFGLPKAEIDELGDKGRYYGPSRVQNNIQHGKQDNIYHLIWKYGKLITGFPHHLSVHAGGMLISEQPIYNYTATFLPPKNFITSQIDMYQAESIGLIKLDILSQRGLGHIKETIRLIKENKNETVNIAEVEKYKRDPMVKAQIKNGNTIGCFYVESPGMRQLLRKMECDDYLTLVAASSIIRPGVAGSGMMKEYVFRYRNPDKFKYLHPLLEDLLKQSFGIMIYQEDMLRVAQRFGGLEIGEADALRKAMSGKYRKDNVFELIREKFFLHCKRCGYSDDLSHEVWRQMESFAGYSFSKAHSASFAVESFQDLYLKAYYPLEFMVGVINNFGGFYPTSLYFYELIKSGATIHLPCVNRSLYLTNIQGTDVHTGLVHIKSLEKKLAEKILTEREQNGPYLHLQDFIERTAVPLEPLNTLISIDAFRFTEKNKKRLLWEANFLQKKNKAHLPARYSLFNEKPRDFVLPALANNPLHDIYDEIEILGFPLRNPFDIVDDDASRYLFSADLPENVGKPITLLGYFITDKVVPTKNNQTMSFGTFIDAALNWIDTIHFSDSLRQYPLQGTGFYRIAGKVVEDGGFYSVEVTQLKKIGYKERQYANL